jgi:hypothetical protein
MLCKKMLNMDQSNYTIKFYSYMRIYPIFIYIAINNCHQRILLIYFQTLKISVCLIFDFINDNNNNNQAF